MKIDSLVYIYSCLQCFDAVGWTEGRASAGGPDLQNILRQSYDYLTIMPKLRSTYDGRLIYKTSYEELRAFLRHDSPAKL